MRNTINVRPGTPCSNPRETVDNQQLEIQQRPTCRMWSGVWDGFPEPSRCEAMFPLGRISRAHSLCPGYSYAGITGLETRHP